MPECVEAETTRRVLEKALLGSSLAALDVIDQERLHLASKMLERESKVTALRRHGKVIMFEFSRQHVLSVSLGMSGSLILTPRQSLATNFPHARLRMNFGKTGCLFIDPRRLGRISWSRLSPEGWDILDAVQMGDINLKLDESLSGSSSAIKLVLMNQSKIAGLGNIYANEILYQAGIHPQRPANLLTRRERLSLAHHARKVLLTALRLGGISMRNYTHPDGQKGRFQQKFLVYGRRRGESCLRCKAGIKMIFLGQRSTFFCPRCQK